jgi:hypothetical protein
MKQTCIHNSSNAIQVRFITGVVTRTSDYCEVKVKSYPCNRTWRPIGFGDDEAPTFSRQSPHNGCVVVSLTRRPPFTPQEIFLVLISVRD